MASSSLVSGVSRPEETTRDTGWEWTETELGSVPATNAIGRPFIDEHGRNYGLVVGLPKGRSLWLNGKYGPVVDDFLVAPIMDAGLVFDYEFSPDGQRLAYAVRQGGRVRMVVDGRPEPPEEAVRYPVFSPNSRHVAYVVRRKGKEHVLVDGVAGPPCDSVGGPIQFSPDGRRMAYVARHGKESCMVIDQKERRDWPGTGRPVFSPDSQRLAYLGDGGSVVVDGVKGPEQGGNTWWGPIFSSDSRHVAYTAGTWQHGAPGYSRAFINGQPLSLPGQGTNVRHVFFSPDLKRWACTLEPGDKEQIYIGGQFEPLYDSVYGLQFSGDGSRYAYLAKQGEDWRMVVDGKLEAEISINPAIPCFSPNGKRLAYIAGRGPEWWMMVDGKAGPKFKGLKERRLLFGLREEEVPGLTQPRFGPDSAHVAYAALQGAQWGVLINHRRVGSLYDSVVRGGPCFLEDGSLVFLGIRNGRLCRIVCKARLP